MLDSHRLDTKIMDSPRPVTKMVNSPRLGTKITDSPRLDTKMMDSPRPDTQIAYSSSRLDINMKHGPRQRINLKAIIISSVEDSNDGSPQYNDTPQTLNTHADYISLQYQLLYSSVQHSKLDILQTLLSGLRLYCKNIANEPRWQGPQDTETQQCASSLAKSSGKNKQKEKSEIYEMQPLTQYSCSPIQVHSYKLLNLSLSLI